MTLAELPRVYPTYAAERFWGHLREIARRLHLDAESQQGAVLPTDMGDAAEHGMDWGERALGKASGFGPVSYSEQIMWADAQEGIRRLTEEHEGVGLWLRWVLDNLHLEKRQPWGAQPVGLGPWLMRVDYKCRQALADWGKEWVYRYCGDGGEPAYPRCCNAGHLTKD